MRRRRSVADGFASTKAGRANGNVQRAGSRPLVCSITGTPDAAYCTSMRFVHKARMSEARRRIPRSAALLGRESTCALPDSSSLGILLWRLYLHVAVFVSAFAYQAIQNRSITQLLAQDKVPVSKNRELQPPCPTRNGTTPPLSRHVNEEWRNPSLAKPLSILHAPFHMPETNREQELLLSGCSTQYMT